MNKENLQHLKNRDPAVRKSAIKAVARAKDRDALKQLAKMAEDDADAEVQKLAAQAVAYIRKQLGETPAPDQKTASDSRSGKAPAKIPVTKKNTEKAQQALKDAQTFLMQDDKPKVAVHLRRALALDPNLRQDGYLVSMAEEATGEAGPAAVAALGEQKRAKVIAQTEAAEKKSQESAEHMEEVAGTGWKDVTFDLLLFTIIALVGVIAALFLAAQSAQRYHDKWQRNIQEMATAYCVTENNETVCYRSDPSLASPGETLPTIKEIWPNDTFQLTMNNWMNTETKQLIVPGLAGGFAGSVGTVLVAIIIHLFGRFIFQGQSRLPHTIHGVTMTLLSRGIALLVIAFAGIVIWFSNGGSTLITQIIMGLGGIWTLITVLSLVRVVSKTLHQAFPLALIATLVGLSPIAALGFFVWQADLLKFDRIFG